MRESSWMLASSRNWKIRGLLNDSTKNSLPPIALTPAFFPLDVGPSRLIPAISANDRHGFFTHPKQRRGEAFSYSKEDEMETTATSTSQARVVSVRQPRFSGFSHPSL